MRCIFTLQKYSLQAKLKTCQAIPVVWLDIFSIWLAKRILGVYISDAKAATLWATKI